MSSEFFKKTLNKFITINYGKNYAKLLSKYPRILNKINYYYGNTIQQKIYNILHDISAPLFCPICKNKELAFKTLSKGYTSFCSPRCACQSSEYIEKRKKAMLDKYGVEYPLQSETIKKKVEDTNISKFGTAHNWSNGSSSRETYKKTMLEKYGVENPSFSPNICKKISDRLKSKTSEEKNEILSKRKETNLSRYGVEHFNNAEKSAQTLRSKYGVEFVGQLNTSDAWLAITDKKTFLETELELSHPLKIARDYKIAFSTVYKDISKYGLRQKIRKQFDAEYILSELLLSVGLVIERNTRKILNGKELDIYIPEKKLAIEFNGLYWHSELNGKDKNYHLNKTIECSKQGIQLIHIFEDEWVNKKDLVKSVIMSKMGLFNKRIYARQCTIKEISTKEKNSFLEENHLQGKDSSSIKLGLFHDNVLVSVMTFGHSRFNKNYQFELHRFASKQGYQIIGGASKLFKYFIRKYNPESIISYADRRYSDGTFYEKIGFISVGVSKPSYFYFKGASKLMSRQRFQKHKLKDKLTIFNSNLTEWENMKINGYDRIWDCGNHIFSWKV